MRRTYLLVPIAALSLMACPGRISDPSLFLDAGPGIPCTTDYIENVYFKNTCATTGCHDPVTKFNGLDLASPGIRARLDSPSMCMSIPLTTFIIEKMHPSPTCGASMPFGGVMASAADIACVTAYLSPDGGLDSDAGVTDDDAGTDAGSGDDAGTDAGADGGH